MNIGSLLNRPDLGLAVVVDADIDRPVTGAHVIEIEDPGRWILPGYLVLTTGVTFVHDPSLQRDFVRSLHSAGASGVVFALGVIADEAPAGLVAECEAVGLSLLTARPVVAFREVVASVMRETALAAKADDSAATETVQDLLMTALDHPDPQQQLVRKLWEVFHLPVGVVSVTGALVNQAGCDNDRVRASLIAASREAPGVVCTPAGQFLVIEVKPSAANSAMHLVVALPGDHEIVPGLRPACGFAARALRMVAISRQMQRDFERRLGASVCQSLVDPAVRVTRRLREEAATLGLTGEEDLTVLRLSGIADSRRKSRRQVSLHHIGSDVHEFMEHLRVPYVAALERDGFLVITQGTDIEDPVRELAAGRRSGSIAIGLSSPTRSLEALPNLATEAKLAHQRVKDDPGRSVVAETFHGDSVADLLMAYVPPAARHGLSDFLAPLEDRPELIETLRGFLANRRDINATASEMYLHPNSIRYRLAKIEDLLACSLDETDVLVSIHVALKERSARTSAPGLVEHLGVHG